MNVKIAPEFWTDPQLEDASPETRLAVLWLLTNPRVNLVGYSEISLKRFVFETGLEKKALADAFKALPKGFKQTESGYWVVNFIRHQLGRGASLVNNNMCKPLLRALAQTGSPWLVEQVLTHYPELRDKWDLVGVEEGSGELPKQKEQNREEKSKSRVREEGDGSRPADLAAVVAYFAAQGAPEAEAAKFFDHYEANGWKQGGRAAIRSWHSSANNWIRRWRDGDAGASPRKNPSRGGAPGGDNGGLQVFEPETTT